MTQNNLINPNFEVIIGLENHVQLKTKTKLFSYGKAQHDADHNTCVNAMDMGYPGVLPVINRRAVELAIRMASYLAMKISPILSFQRKNYDYQDLAKGYQITQQDNPIGRSGTLSIKYQGAGNSSQEMKVAIERLHLEEDTAKTITKGHRQQVFLNYNRSGWGLIEIVTKPVLQNASQVCAYIKKLQQLLVFGHISDARMDQGSLRCDLNISVRPCGSSHLGAKTEVKNLNSLRNIELAIKNEVDKQISKLTKNWFSVPNTARFDEVQQQTVIMRTKFDNYDYRFMFEPNLPSLNLKQTWIQNIKANLPPTRDDLQQRYLKVYQLPLPMANNLLDHHDLRLFFDATRKLLLECAFDFALPHHTHGQFSFCNFRQGFHQGHLLQHHHGRSAMRRFKLGKPGHDEQGDDQANLNQADWQKRSYNVGTFWRQGSCGAYSTLANFLSSVHAYLKKHKLLLSATTLQPKRLKCLVDIKVGDQLSSVQAKQILLELLTKDTCPKILMQKNHFKYERRKSKISKIIRLIMHKQEAFLNKNRSWPDRNLKFLMGQFMRQTKQQASPQVAMQVIEHELRKKNMEKFDSKTDDDENHN